MDSTYTLPVNIGSQYEISVNTLVQTILKLCRCHFRLPHDLRIEYTTIDKDDPKVRRPDLSIYETVTQSNPECTPLDTGLLKTITYFKELIDNNRIEQSIKSEI